MSTTNLSAYDASKIPSAEEMRFAIVVADWNPNITYAMCEGAVETLKKHGAKDMNISIYHVPGSFELIYACSRIKKFVRDIDAIIALGSVVRGGTPHFDYVCSGTTEGIARLNNDGDVPVIFGLLTTDDMKQAEDRAGGCLGNKGVECAQTAIRMADLKDKIWDGKF